MKYRDLFRFTAVLITVAVLASCTGSRGGGSGESKTAQTAAASPESSDSSYLATDYDKPGHPELGSEDVEQIRAALAKVKACQKPILRYAFPDGYGRAVLFFGGKGPNEYAHVFGKGNFFYIPARNVIMVVPANASTIDAKQAIAQGIEWDVDHQPCPHGLPPGGR
ncbi:MAG: hypothetical protein WA814_11975 [Candidatus Baltobacteraceae bacterium]